MQWRVGNGDKVKILGKKWLPIRSSYCVQFPVKILNKDERVKRLINEHTQEWKEDLVREFFIEEEADQICRIPLI